jgi:hypothetical protein
VAVLQIRNGDISIIIERLCGAACKSADYILQNSQKLALKAASTLLTSAGGPDAFVIR